MSVKLRFHHSNILGQIIIFTHVNRLVMILLLSLFLLLFCQYNKSINSQLSFFAIKLSNPFHNILVTPLAIYHNIKQKYIDIAFLASKHKKLNKNYNILQKSIIRMNLLDAENKSLRLLLNYNDLNNYKYITSKIFVNNNNHLQKTTVIDKGLDSNIAVGQAVIGDNGMVGRVLKVQKDFSHILLLSDTSSKVPVYSSKSQEKAIMVGQNNDYPVLKYLVKDNNIINNEIIYSSGDGMMYPANIPLGVTLIDDSNNVRVIPFVKFNKLQFVKILTLVKN
jgi:rod shape-determining protein MreC